MDPSPPTGPWVREICHHREEEKAGPDGADDAAQQKVR